jgi:hypothetical protein
MAAPSRTAKLRKWIQSARRMSNSAQASFLRSEDVHATLAEREERRSERERSTPDDSADRFPQLGRRQST